jgi:hypothetical protein
MTRDWRFSIIIIQFNSIYLSAKPNSPEANYKVSTGKKMGRVRSKKVSENNNSNNNNNNNNNNSIQFNSLFFMC